MSTMKKAKPKRLLSLLLTVVMLLGLLPLSAVPVSATEAEQSNATSMLAATNGLNEDLPTWNTSPTWELIKDVFFQDTRLKLLRDWLGSDTDSTGERYIRLEADIEVSADYLKDSEKIVVNGKKVLDLNGHKISIKLGKGAGYSGRKIAITVNEGATLMVIDSRGGGKIFGDSWICAPEDLGYERASTDLFYNKGTLIINVPDGEIETGRSKKQWVTAASENGVKESIAYARYSGYIRGQSNGSAIIGSKESTTVIVSGRVIGRGFYKFGQSPWGTSTDTPYQRCTAVRTDGTFIMYGGEIYGMGGANVLSAYTERTMIYAGYFRTTTIDRMAIQADEQEDLTSDHANFTKKCEYGSIGVKGFAPDAEYFNGKHDATVRPKSVTDMTSDSIVLSHNYGVNIIDPQTQDMWVVYAYYKPYFSLTARNYVGNGGYTGDPYGYDYKLSTNWKARAEFTILDSNGEAIGYCDTSNWLKDEADKSTFRCDVLACKPTRGQSIIWMSAHTYTLRCKITESWGGDPAQTRTVYQDLAFSIWDQDTLQAAKSMDFEFTPTSTAKGDPTNFIVSLKDSCLTAASDNFITKMDIRYSYYEPITNSKGEVTQFEKKTETAEIDADIIVESRDMYNRRVWSIGRDTALRPKAAGPIEVAIDIYTSNGPLVDTKTYKIFAMPALTGRFLSSEKYTVPADGYTMEARYTAWKAYMDSGLGKFANMSDYGITPASVIWQYYDLETNKFVDIARGDSRFVFEGDTIFATNRTGEYRASYEFQGVRYYSPRTIYVIAQSYDTTYEPYITGPGYAEYGENALIKVKLNDDADWSGVSEYTLICRRYPQGAGLRVTQSTNTTGEFTLEKDFFRNSMAKEKFVPGDYIFEAKVRHANGVATSVRFIIPYGVTSSGFTFSVDDKKAERLNTGDGKYVMLSGNDSIFKVNYALYPENSTEEQYPADEYDYTYVNLTKDIISLADDGVASILAPGDAKIQLKVVKKSTGATVASPTLTVTIPVVGFEVEEPNYNDCIGQNWSDMKATVKSVWGPGGRKVTTDTDKYMTVSLKAKIGSGFDGNKVTYNDQGDITWTAQTKPGYQFAMEIVSTDTLNGKTCIICRADVSTIETNAFTDTVKTAREHGLYSAIHGEYTYYPGEDYRDPTSATFEMTSRNIHVKDPNMQYIDVVSITTSTPAVGDPRYEGTDSNRYYSEYMTVKLGSLSDLLCADESPMVRAETKVSKLGAITGSGKPYDNAQVDSSTEYTSVFNFSDGIANPPTKKYEAGIYENWLRLDIIGQDASGKKYGFAPDVKLFVNGHLIEFAGVYYNAPPTNSRLDVFYYFDVGAVTQYNTATVDATDITPTVGMKPKGADSVSVEGTDDIEVTKLLWFVDANGNGKCDSGEEATIENGHLAADGTFLANKQYSMDLEVGVADGAEGRLAQPFALKVKYDDSLATERKTKEQTVGSVDPNGVFTFPYTYITSVDEKVNKPENGVYTKSAALLSLQSAEEAQKKGYTIHSFEWKNLDGTQVEEEELIPGKKYRHEVTLVHNGDVSRFAPPLTVVKIDGQTLKSEKSATESWVEAASNTLTIHYIFTVPDPAVTGYTISGSVASFGNETDDVTIQLIAEGTTEAAYEVVVQGNAASYSIDNVVPGTYTMKVMKVKHVTKEYTVTVEGSHVTRNVKIHLLGDVTGNGAIDTADAVLVLQRAAGLIGDDFLEATAADVNGDKAIDTADAVLILQKSAALIDKFLAEA